MIVGSEMNAKLILLFFQFLEKSVVQFLLSAKRRKHDSHVCLVLKSEALESEISHNDLSRNRRMKTSHDFRVLIA